MCNGKKQMSRSGVKIGEKKASEVFVTFAKDFFRKKVCKVFGVYETTIEDTPTIFNYNSP